MTEKRSGERATIALFATIHIGDLEYSLHAVDLSVGGIRVEFDGETLETGKDVSVDFELPDGERTIYLDGKVAHCTDGTLGIEFGKVKKGIKRALQQFVDDYGPLS